MADHEGELGPEPLHVLPISPGIALGPVRLFQSVGTRSGHEHIKAEQLADELHRLYAAISRAEQELDTFSTRVAHTVGEAEAGIFVAQKLMLRDPELLAEVEAAMKEQLLAAPEAWSQVVERQSAELAGLGNATLAERAADVRDMGSRVLAYLQTEASGATTETMPQEPALLVVYDLTPSQTAGLHPASILGICTVEGGPTTHAAIIARALEIPAVAGLDPHVLGSLSEGQEVAIDGTSGLVYLQPEGTQRELLREAMEATQRSRREKRSQNEERWSSRPGKTADGQAVLIYANVGDVLGAQEAGERGAQGIGLLRTEFLFGQRATFPNEQEQLEGYIAVFRAFAIHARFGKTVVARTLDAGADKPLHALEQLLGKGQEPNPALGLRGARIHLLHQELLCRQLRALLRAARETRIHLRIMFPMIATLEETRRLKQILQRVKEEMTGTGTPFPQDIQVGIMIETPSAVWMADALAREVDFFSIGANDLFQYTLAADRTNNQVMGLFGVVEPALWRSIAHVVQVARTHDCPVAVCGEIAANPHIGPLLAGLGVEELSVSPPALSKVKEALAEQAMLYWQTKAHALLEAQTAAEMETIFLRK